MDNYYDTAKRMQKSSKILFNNQEYHNSCYLAGYVIECYAKIIIGLSYTFNANDLKSFGHDLKEMNKEFHYIFNHSSISAYIKDLKINFENITKGNSKWNPNKRYINQNLEWTESNAKDYQNEIIIAMQTLAQMKLNGLTLI
jgi:HEPN domain-containing protein